MNERWIVWREEDLKKMRRSRTSIQLPRKPEKLPEPKKLRPQQPPGTCWIPGEWRFFYPDHKWVWNAGHWRDIEPHQVPESPDKTDFGEEGCPIPDMKSLAILLEAMEIARRHSEKHPEFLQKVDIDDPNLRAVNDRIVEKVLDEIKKAERYNNKARTHKQ